MSVLRVIDVGRVSGLRSQALWHGIAESMTPTTAPTLSMCQPGEPYVGLGYHRSLAELDLETCRRRGLGIIRRQIGGGPVYIDPDQLFFQITLPAALAPRRVDRLYKQLLEPAVQAFQRLGIAAEIRGLNDISIEDRRLSGTGAGRIKDGVTVVGNVIFRFPHRRMAEILALPAESMRRECRRLMEAHVTCLEAEGLGKLTAGDAQRALVAAYSDGLDLTPEPAGLSAGELEAIECWESRFEDQAWLEGPSVAPPTDRSRQVKITADVWFYAATREDLALQASFRSGWVDRLRVSSPRLNGIGAEIAHRVAGCPVARLEERLAPFGHPGDRILELLREGALLR